MAKKRINSKAKGTRFEYKVRDKLKKEGWFVVRQAASTFPDLIAIHKNGTLNIQFAKIIFRGGPVLAVECKVNKYLTKEEKQKFKTFREITGAHCYIAYPKRIGRKVEIWFEEFEREKKWTKRTK